MDLLQTLRARTGRAVFARVAGPEGPAHRKQIHDRPGPRWFAPDRPIRVVHADASMFVGGLAALLLQSLHPLAMAAVAGHSGFRGDPWGRLQRTSTFLATTTYATAADAQAAVDRVRAIHAGISGTTTEGEVYHASDPHLLTWVHIAEVYCFSRAHRQYGAHPLTPAAYDDYLLDTAQVATALGANNPPRTQTALEQQLAAYRPELRATPAAKDASRFLLREPPLPAAVRPPYAALALGAIELLPPWARAQLGLRPLSPRGALLARAGARTVTRTLRWAMTPPPPST